jgi:hypothetical protein
MFSRYLIGDEILLCSPHILTRRFEIIKDLYGINTANYLQISYKYFLLHPKAYELFKIRHIYYNKFCKHIPDVKLVFSSGKEGIASLYTFSLKDYDRRCRKV